MIVTFAHPASGRYRCRDAGKGLVVCRAKEKLHREGLHEASPPRIPASGRGRRRAAGSLARRMGASLSVAAGELDRVRSRRRHTRHHRAARGPSDVSAARPVGGHRQPSRRRRQSRPAGGRARAGRRLHAADGRHPARHQCRRSTRRAPSPSPATSFRSRASSDAFVAGEPAFPAKTVRSSSPTPRPIPARSTSARAGPAT